MIADRFQEILSQASLSDQVRDWQRQRALSERYGRFDLPSRDQATLYRVRSLGVRIDSSAGAAALRTPGGELPLRPGEEDAASWIIARDYVDESELGKCFASPGPDRLQDLLGRLEACSVLDRI
ncbi:MAG: hypothetical protein BMS9Abin01_0148 [Gammaproteobacteria bacterium]|nr:MAG: hypothetical protein BMS9Abin01_0148 [Gammaproteobacteria bacterium]